MNEHIRREDAINWLSTLKSEIGQSRYMSLWPYGQALDEIIYLLEAGVRENVRGEWIVNEKQNPNGVDWCHCSVCGGTNIKQNISSINFCPNCGADMRKETDG